MSWSFTPEHPNPDVRRIGRAAFFTLVALMASTSMMDTARDALFLARLPPSQLPYVYIAVAVLAGIVLQLLRRLGGAGTLYGLLCIIALGNTLFWYFLPESHDVGLYALYLWTSVVSTAAMIQFWIRMSGQFDVGTAKQVFPFVATGSIVGAVLGTLAASVLASQASARHLLLAASVPLLFIAIPLRQIPLADRSVSRRPTPRNTMLNERYTKYLGALLVWSMMAFTVADWLFKEAVTRAIEPDDLGLFFSVFYLVLNLVSFAVQTTAVNRTIKNIGLTASLVTLPLMLGAATTGVLLMSGLGAALTLKFVQGATQHSLHKTSVELLYVPLPPAARNSIKGWLDAFGERGGKAIASAAILAVLAVGGNPAWLLAILLVGWFLAAIAIRRPYFHMFRTTLRDAVELRTSLPDLNVDSLSAIIEQLSSTHDEDVLAALDLMHHHGRLAAVPTLMVYHPSEAVVLRTLTLLVQSGRTDWLAPADRVFDKAPSAVRAAILRSQFAVQPDVATLVALADDDDSATRATACALAWQLGAISPTMASQVLNQIVTTDDVPAKQALAAALATIDSTVAERLLAKLAHDPSDRVRTAAFAAMAKHPPEPDLVEAALSALALRASRKLARAQLQRWGTLICDDLSHALSDDKLPFTVRWEIPHVIARLPAERSVPILLEHLNAEQTRRIQYRLLRALEWVKRHNANVQLDNPQLEKFLKCTLREVVQLVQHRRALIADPSIVDSEFGQMLCQVLDEKAHQGFGRAVLLLGLRTEERGVPRIERGLSSSRSGVRAASIELLDILAPAELKALFVGLATDMYSDATWHHAEAAFPTAPQTSKQVLRQLRQSNSQALSILAEAVVPSLARESR